MTCRATFIGPLFHAYDDLFLTPAINRSIFCVHYSVSALSLSCIMVTFACLSVGRDIIAHFSFSDVADLQKIDWCGTIENQERPIV